TKNLDFGEILPILKQEQGNTINSKHLIEKFNSAQSTPIEHDIDCCCDKVNVHICSEQSIDEQSTMLHVFQEKQDIGYDILCADDYAPNLHRDKLAKSITIVGNKILHNKRWESEGMVTSSPYDYGIAIKSTM
uniref:Uncharacterized protein n=1 Tax=Romanomermis culicivorax TaxID=13658 RepID=A0A915L4G5_ROMCU